MLTIRSCSLAALFVLASCVQPRIVLGYGDEAQIVTDTQWLGDPPPQGDVQVGSLMSAEFDILLRVVAGASAVLEPTRNITYWFFDGECSEGARAFKADRTYLVASIHPSTKHAGRLARCTVRILGGPLQGAVVCIKPYGWVKNLSDPSYAVFEVPESVVLFPGYVPFRVVDFASK